MRNLAELLTQRAERSPDLRVGLIDGDEPFGELLERARRTAGTLLEHGMAPGSRVALIGSNSRAYLQTWMALQLVGAEAALINPTYPAGLTIEMLQDFEPESIVTVGPVDAAILAGPARTFDLTDVDRGRMRAGDEVIAISDRPVSGVMPGLEREPGDVAGYMHTSGTTGTPKFCVQTHEYFLRLGRYIADVMSLSDRDTVFAPLPMFHINPLGYGLIGGLVAGANVVTAARFSASRFWPDVIEAKVTALILHGPPVEILKRATSRSDSRGHSVRIMFFGDMDFLEEFEVPLGVSAYGSTEAGGLCHAWVWRRGDPSDLPEGVSRYGGASRHEVEWRIDDGEILVRSRRPNVLFTGYWKRGDLVRPFDADGWFHTGDLGRVDEAGNLVFIERRAESIRVKGEFVPIGFVEGHFAHVGGVVDVALWRQDSTLVDDDVALYVSGEQVDFSGLRAARAELPPFMRPAVVKRVAAIPRDSGVGKVRRRDLDGLTILESVSFS